MDYVYGILNERVKPVNYRGLDTDTAVTTVDNAAGTIQVTGRWNKTNINSLISTAISKLDYDDVAETGKFVTEVNEKDGVVSVKRALITTDKIADFDADVTSIVNKTVPPQPQTDGTFTLKVKVENGEATYYWESVAENN